jgi:hypothetical protein
MSKRPAAAILPLLLVLPVVTTQPLAAQGWPGVFPGAEVRIVSSQYQGQATVVRVHAQSLELVVTGLDGTVVVPAPGVQRLDVRVRRTGWHGARRGAIWGGLIGAAAGAFGDPPEEEDGLWGSSGGVILGTGFIGAGFGAAVGAIFPGKRWVPVAIPGSPVLRLEGSGRITLGGGFTPGG